MWRAAPDATARSVEGPAEGEGVRDRAAADWTGVSQGEDERDLGTKVAGSSSVSLEMPGEGGRPATAVAVGGERNGTAVTVGGGNMF